MCIRCHSNLNDENVKKSLLNIVEGNAQFEVWNSTSVSHIIIAGTGYNGCEIRKLGIKSLELYNEWLINNPTKILHNTLNPTYIKKIIHNIKNTSIKHNNTDDLINKIDSIYNV